MSLAEKRGEPVDRSTILDRVWGYDAFPSTRTVDNFIVGLRKVLEPDPSLHMQYLGPQLQVLSDIYALPDLEKDIWLWYELQ